MRASPLLIVAILFWSAAARSEESGASPARLPESGLWLSLAEQHVCADGKSDERRDVPDPVYMVSEASPAGVSHAKKIRAGRAGRKKVEGSLREAPAFIVGGLRVPPEVKAVASAPDTLSAKVADEIEDAAYAFEFLGREYVLRTTGNRLSLSSGASTQDLGPLDKPQPSTHLHWLGDLDGDDKLDLVIDLWTDYNEGYDALFLSSRAGPGQLVASAARREFHACD